VYWTLLNPKGVFQYTLEGVTKSVGEGPWSSGWFLSKGVVRVSFVAKKSVKAGVVGVWGSLTTVKLLLLK